MKVTNEINETEKKIELSLFSFVSHIAILNFLIILSIALMLENISLKTLIFNSII